MKHISFLRALIVSLVLCLLVNVFSACEKVDNGSSSTGGVQNEEKVQLESEGLEYKLLADNTYQVVGLGDCLDSDLIIPSVWKGKPVSSVGEKAFYQRGRLRSVKLPDSILALEKKAFSNCRNLAAVDLGNGLERIGEYAFSECRSIKHLTIPDSVITIESNAFVSSNALMYVRLGKSVKTIGESAFHGTSLITITIPNSVVEIGGCAFVSQRLIEICNDSSVEIIKKVGSYAENVKNIYSSTQGASKLSLDENKCIIYPDEENKILVGYVGEKTELSIPEGITEIYARAFTYCKGLAKVEIPKSVKSIGNDAFSNCTNLSSIVLPDHINIGSGVFYGCEKLIEINVPSSWTKIGDDAFNGMGLTSILIPQGITSIGSGAFAHTQLKSLVVPDSVTEIGRDAFRDCPDLEFVVLGSGVRKLGTQAFYGSSRGRLTVYYKGSEDMWDSMDKGTYLGFLDLYFYSEEQPTEEGRFWHYAEDGKTVLIWEEKE